jgi:flagellar P-ring protein precursor FlgI
MKKIPAALLLLTSSLPLFAEGGTRLKELVSLQGVRDNQLMGYGLVVGLAGKGDSRQTVFSAQSLANLLERMGLTVSPQAIQSKNIAAVMVTAVLPPYSQPGGRIDVTVSAVGDAPSLQGGVLLMAGLKGPDGQVYAVAQGPLVIGGFVTASSGTSTSVNHPTVGRIPNGAIVERGIPMAPLGNELHFRLQDADSATASRIVTVLDKQFGPSVAHADNAASIRVVVPEGYRDNVTGFLADLERLTVDTDRVAKVIVNERTGTIVMGKDVQISPVAIMQGNLTVEIQTSFAVSQPNPMSSGGTPQVTPQTNLNVKQELARNVVLKNGSTVEELVRALTAIGSTPRDIISILQNLKSAGALGADLQVI